MTATTLGIPINQTSSSSFASSSTGARQNGTTLRATRSESAFRTPNSSSFSTSDIGLSTDASRFVNNTSNNFNTSSSGGLAITSGAGGLSLSPPPDLTFSRSSLHSDQETEFLSRIGGIGSSTSFNQPYLDDDHHHQLLQNQSGTEQVRIASSSRDELHDPSTAYRQNDSWGSRTSKNNLNINTGLSNNASSSSKSRIRLDSVFGTQLPGFPYLNSTAAATSFALGNPINPNYHYVNHHASSSSADLMKGRSSYIWSERSNSSIGHHRSRAPTSHSLRSINGKESIMSMTGRNTPALSNNNSNQGTKSMTAGRGTMIGAQGGGDIDTSCSGETGESNSSDEVDLDLSFDMDILRARQMQQFQARQLRDAAQHHQSHQVDNSSSQIQAQRQQARNRAMPSSESIPHSKSGHVGIDMLDNGSEQNQNALNGLPYHESEEHRRYLLGGKKRLSRSAVELRPGQQHSKRSLQASIAAATPTTSSVRTQSNHPYRQSGALSATLPTHTGRGTRQQIKSSHASLDLAIDIPLDQAPSHPPHPPFIDEDESSAHLGWSFATTPPLSPAEIVTYAENNSGIGSKGQRRYSAGASNLFHSLDRKKSSSELLQRKRRPSFPLMSLFDKAIKTPVAGLVVRAQDGSNNGPTTTTSPHSPDSDVSWGSPTPRESVVLDLTTTVNPTTQQVHLHGNQQVPLYPLPIDSQHLQDRYNEHSGASISDLVAQTPESNNGPLSLPPRLYDPARLGASPISNNSSLGTPCTLSPDMGATTSSSTFSSPRSPNDDLPTPRTADFIHHHDQHHSSETGNSLINQRYSQFSLKAMSEDARMSYISTGSETVEGGVYVPSSKRESRIFGMGGSESPTGITANLAAISEQSDSPQKSTVSTSSTSSCANIGTSPKKVEPPSASMNQSVNGGESSPSQSQVDNMQQQQQQQQQQNQGHKRQSSSLFRFPFVSSLRNPFTSRSVSGPSTSSSSASPNLNNNDLSLSSSSSRGSPSGSVEELLSTSAIAAGSAPKNDSSAIIAKRSTSPNSSEESHFLPPSDPPSPPRPGATTEASKGIDPSMLRQGPNTGKGRLSGLGLSFPSSFANSPSSIEQQNSTTTMSRHQAQRQASLPVLSFSAASDEQHEVSARSVESEEAAIQVIPDENGYGRPVEHQQQQQRNSLQYARRSVSDIGPRPFPTSAPATTVHFNHPSVGLDDQVEQMHSTEFAASDNGPKASHSAQSQTSRHYRRPRTRLLSAQGLDLRGRIDRMRPSQLLFLAAFVAGPWCFLVGGWCLRSIDGDYRSTKGIRCRCPNSSESCDCQAEIYKQIKLSGGHVDRVLQSQNGEIRKMDRFVLANRVAALTCGTGTLVLAITALIVVGRAW